MEESDDLRQRGDRAPREMAEFFDSVAHSYEDHILSVKSCPIREFYDRVFDPVSVTSTSINVLDIGIGSGLELPGLLTKAPNAKITGIDLSAEMLKRLRSKFADLGPRLEIVQGSYLDFDFPDAQYDYIVSVMTLHHLLHDVKRDLYERLCRALKPGGKYIEGDYVSANAEEEKGFLVQHEERVGLHPHSKQGRFHVDVPLTIETQMRLLIEAGFGDVEIAFHEGSAAILVARR